MFALVDIPPSDAAATPSPPSVEPPTAWGQIALLTTANFVFGVGLGAIMPYLPVFLHEKGGAHVGMIGVVAAAAFLPMALFSGVFGRLSDAFGRKPFLIASSALFALATLLFVTTTSPIWFILFRFVEGLAAAVATPVIFALVADITAERSRSQAYGWLTTGQFGGLIFGPALAVGLFWLVGGGLWGFRALFLAGSGLCVLLTIVLAVWLREPVRSRTHRQEKKERPPLRSIVTLPIACFMILGATGAYSMGVFEVLWSIWLRHLGAPMSYVGLTWIAFSAPMLLSFAGGWIADRTNRFLVMTAGFAVAGVVWILYGATRDLTLFLALNCIEGLVIAFAYPAKEAFLTQVSPPKLLGTVMGVEQMAIQVATFAATLVAPLVYAGFVIPDSVSLGPLGEIDVPAVSGLGMDGLGGYALSVAGVLSLAGLVVATPVLGREWRRLQRRATAAEAGRILPQG